MIQKALTRELEMDSSGKDKRKKMLNIKFILLHFTEKGMLVGVFFEIGYIF